MTAATVACAVCDAPIDPRTQAHYQAEGSGRRWCLAHGVAYIPRDLTPTPPPPAPCKTCGCTVEGGDPRCFHESPGHVPAYTPPADPAALELAAVEPDEVEPDEVEPDEVEPDEVEAATP